MADYTVLSECTTLVTQLTNIDGAVKLILIDQNLIDSAGTLNAVPFYRPYYVAARQLQRNRTDQALKQADGATFTNLATMIQSLLEEQKAIDTALGVDVPAGFSADEALERLCGCKDPDGYESNPMTAMVI
jgi:hypothetical protein